MEFEGFPKIPRLSRECIITEKIDGTNSCIYIGEDGEFLIGSRSKWITTQADNFGFAQWAYQHKDELISGLGIGRHFGEWWGSGIQRGYGLPKGEKRFSLFNTSRWSDDSVRPSCCYVVPIIKQGLFDTNMVHDALAELRMEGSFAAPGFMNPEGIVIFHVAGNLMFKKTIKNDEVPKGSKEAR
jgi:hypothetical protein